MSRTVVVYRAQWTAGPNLRREFFIWKLVNESLIGFEEIHYLNADGGAVDPGEHKEVALEFVVTGNLEDVLALGGE